MIKMDKKRNREAPGELTPEQLDAALAKEERLNRLSLVLLVAVVALLFAVALGLLFRYGILTLPEPVAEFFHLGAENSDASDEDRIFAALNAAAENGSGEYDGLTVSSSLDDNELRALIASSVGAATYSADIEISYYSDSSRAQYKKRITRDGDVWSVEELGADGQTVLKTACAGGRVTVTSYGDDGEPLSSREYPSGGIFTFEATAGLPELDALRALLADSIEGAAAGESGRGFIDSVALVRTSDAAVYFVRYIHPGAEMTDDFYIDLATGLVLRCETYLGERLLYSATAVVGS